MTNEFPSTPKERHDKLIELWCAVLDRLHSLFTDPPPEGLRATYYAVAIQFLRNNGITAQDMKDPQEGMKALAEQIAEVTGEQQHQEAGPTVGGKASSRVVVPLNQPFEHRPPRAS